MEKYKQYKKRQKEQNKELKSNKRFKHFHFLTPEYRKKQKAGLDHLLSRSNESAKEKKLYEEFVKIVEDSYKQDNKHKKFSLEFIERLGIQHDILFLSTKKDAGKNGATAVYITKLLEKEPEAQIAFIRNTKEEAKGFVEMMNNSDIWPVWTDGELVYKKSDIYKLGKRKSKPCGIFAYCSGTGFTRWQGGDWQNLRFGYWDECNTVTGGLTESVFHNFNVFLSSLIRDKDGAKRVRGLMTGNLLEKRNIFLERLGVSARTRLKIVKVHKGNDSKQEVLSTLLYMNTGDMFKGIDEQKALATQFLTDEERNNLLSNRPGMIRGKAIYEEIHLKDLDPMFCFMFRQTEETKEGNATVMIDYILYLYRAPNNSRFVMWIDKFNEFAIKPGFAQIYAGDRRLINKYRPVIPVEEKEEFGESFIKPLEQFLLVGEVWFGWNGTEDIFEINWPTFESKFIKEEEKSK